MDRERHAEVKALLAELVDRPEAERAALLDEVCAGSPSLRAEVEDLLSLGDEMTRSFLENSPVGTPRRADDGEPGRGPRPPSSPLDGGRFAPGEVVAGRYRVVAALGRGGMGEVYRADDLKLGEPVALKLLPPDLASDAAALARFHREVRLARQIAHPNVCRVHDIAEFEGEHFLTMEYIDGEDLSSLLRRIGRLPEAKGVELARQICRGLAAAHDAGVLHRDLKPANVMIDGRGHAKITDFGLAGLQHELREAEPEWAGTPAYMAPEQLRAGRGGAPLGPQTDVYALGLVLFELFTGERAFPNEDWREVVARGSRSGPPGDPRDHVADLDPVIAEVVLRCLEDDPEDRPPSARALLAGLPGGDPLRAALEAGETPSPEMVAGAASVGALSRRAGLTLLVVFALSLVALHALGRTRLLGMIDPEKPPAVLEDRALSLLDELGWTGGDADGVSAFHWETERIGGLARASDRPSEWAARARRRPALLTYRVRRSAAPLVAPRAHQSIDEQVAPRPGDALVVLDPSGRLERLRLDPPGPAAVGEPDWASLFAAAELDTDAFARLPDPPADGAERFPLHDRRWRWEGELDGRSLRVDAASFGALPVAFVLRAPGEPLDGAAAAALGPDVAAGLGLFLLVLVPAGFLARRNLRSGRADSRGARTVGLALAGFSFVGNVLLVHHPGGLAEISILFAQLTHASFAFVVGFGIYTAIEPEIRSRAPHLLIAWTRLIRGRWRDSRVGRDVLVGLAAGMSVTASAFAVAPLVDRFVLGFGGQAFFRPDAKLGSFEDFLGVMIFGPFLQTIGTLAFALVFALLLAGTKRTWVAAAILVAPATLLGGAAFWAVLAVTLLARYGVLATVALWSLTESVGVHPATIDASDWWAWPNAWLPSVVFLAIAVQAFRQATGANGATGG